jgi:L-threonylcarbamoyladenylate synthase
METIIIQQAEIEKAIEGIKEGQLVAFPTETVYGLGADATNESAVKSVYAAKGRPSDNPLIVHVANKNQVAQFVEQIPEKAVKLMEHFWPGPLTLIFNLKEESGLSSTVTGGLKTAAFRMPNNELTLKLITESEKVLVGPSANTSGLPSPTTAKHV